MGWRRRVTIVVGGVALIVGGLYLVAYWRTPKAIVHPFFTGQPGRHHPLVVAHQGGELLRPSNTMVAFDHAVSLGADVIDTDLHRTADGVLVLIHDETVDRTSDGTGAVSELTLSELKDLDFGYTFTPDATDATDATEEAGSFPYRGQGITIVTVDELFDRFEQTDLRFGIEIKQTTGEAAADLCALITRRGLENRVLVSSFAQPNMEAFRQACPTVATSATEGETRSFYLMHRLGLSDLITPTYDAFQVPEQSGRFTIVTPGFLNDATAHGLPVVPWTIDEVEAMDNLVDLEVEGINTNRPDLLVERVQAGP